MTNKVTFSGADKLIIVNPNVTDIDVAEDLYSEWKRWALQDDNAKFLAAFRTFGGDSTVPGQFAPRYFFLINGWQILVNNGEEVTIGVNLYTDNDIPIYIVENNSAVIDRNSDAVVVDRGIEQSSDYQGKIILNTLVGVSGTNYPIGTYALPVNNIEDAIVISNQTGIKDVYLFGGLTISTNIQDLNIFGSNTRDEIILNSVELIDVSITQCLLHGTYSGFINVNSTILKELSGLSGIFKNCGISEDLYFSENSDVSVIDSHTLLTSNINTPTLYLNNSVRLSMNRYSGSLKLENCLSDSEIYIDYVAGSCIIENTCTDGIITLRGIGQLQDNSNGTLVITDGLFQPDKPIVIGGIR
jgi:hypothetical protein